MKYVGKQKALAFAVMAMLASGSAQAVVDIKAKTGAVAYAKEIKFDDANPASFSTAAGDAANSGPLDLTSAFGSGLSASKQYFVRYQLSAGEWTDGTAAISSIIAGTSSTTVGAVANPVAAYLAPNDAGAFIIPLDIGTTAGSSLDSLTIDFAASKVVFRSTAGKPITGNVVTISVTIFEDQVDANNNNLDRSLTSYTADYIKTSDTMFSFSEVDYSNSPNVVDVLQQSRFFTDGVTANLNTAKLCEISIEETAALLSSGAPANSTAGIDAASSTSVLKIKGDFSAVAEGGAFTDPLVKQRVFLTTSSGATPGTAAALGNCVGLGAQPLDTATTEIATSVSATEATFAIGADTLIDMVDDAAAAGSTGKVSVCMTVNGVTSIPAGTYEVAYEPVATAGYTVEPHAFGSCAPFTKNGSTADVPLVANAASAWPQFMRVTNPTSIGGKVHIYAIDDQGLKKGPMSFDLAAGSSTGLITVQQILDGTGAVALDTVATVGVGKLNKMRLWVEAEFGNGHNNTQTGVTVRTYVTPNAAQGGAFTQFQ